MQRACVVGHSFGEHLLLLLWAAGGRNTGCSHLLVRVRASAAPAAGRHHHHRPAGAPLPQPRAPGLPHRRRLLRHVHAAPGDKFLHVRHAAAVDELGAAQVRMMTQPQRRRDQRKLHRVGMPLAHIHQCHFALTRAPWLRVPCCAQRAGLAGPVAPARAVPRGQPGGERVAPLLLVSQLPACRANNHLGMPVHPDCQQPFTAMHAG